MKVEVIKNVPSKPLFLSEEVNDFVLMFNRYLLQKHVDYSSLQNKEKINALRRAISHCQRCALRQECQKPVAPLLTEQPKVMFVARNPGAQEDREGTVMFSQAPSGRLLAKYLEFLEVTRNEIVITNCCHCHSHNNRPPDLASRAKCALWKVLEFDAIKVPRYIFTLGNEALRLFMGNDFPSISHVHGNIYQITIQQEAKLLIPMFHPSYVLRNPAVKRDVLAILQVVKKDMKATL